MYLFANLTNKLSILWGA